MTDWTDVVVRAAGLSGRLLGRAKLTELAQARTVGTVAEVLATGGLYGASVGEAADDPAKLEAYTRRQAGAHLATIARWSGERVPQLAAIYEDEDRRSLRAILRGVLAGTPIEQRLSGLVPTPSLPEAALQELARQATAAEVASLLMAWGNAYGTAIFADASRQHPDALRLQVAIDAEYARRALAASRKAGRQMLRYVRFQIDVENAWTALALAGREVQYDPEQLFVKGGRVFAKRAFIDVATQPDLPRARARLQALSAATDVAKVALADEAEAEDRLLREAIRTLERETVLDPLGTGVVLEFALRLRAELRDLGRIVWGIVLHIPRRELADSLVTT